MHEWHSDWPYRHLTSRSSLWLSPHVRNESSGQETIREEVALCVQLLRARRAGCCHSGPPAVGCLSRFVPVSFVRSSLNRIGGEGEAHGERPGGEPAEVRPAGSRACVHGTPSVCVRCGSSCWRQPAQQVAAPPMTKKYDAPACLLGRGRSFQPFGKNQTSPPPQIPPSFQGAPIAWGTYALRFIGVVSGAGRHCPLRFMNLSI